MRQPVFLRLGLNDESTPADSRPETERPTSPADPVSSREEAAGEFEDAEPLELQEADRFASLDEAIQELVRSEPEPDEPVLVVETAIPHTAPEDVAEAVVYWLTHYKANPSWAARNIRELVAKAPERVVQTVLPLYESGTWGEATPVLARLLATLDATTARLCDPAASLEVSVGIAKALMRHEPGFDARFARSLLDHNRIDDAARQRGLAIMEKLGIGGRLIPILIQFLRDPDSRVRSKAALMFGQIVPTRGIMDKLIGDADARVRANLVEGLWNCPDSNCRLLFRQALEDPHQRVVGNALVGLQRLGETREVMRYLGKMVRRPEALFRATAAWVIGQTGDERYAEVLRHMARDPDPLVRRNALRSLRQVHPVPAVRGLGPDQLGGAAPSNG